MLMLIVDIQQHLQSLALRLADGLIPHRVTLSSQCQTPIAVTFIPLEFAATQIARIVAVLVLPTQATVVIGRKLACYVPRQVVRAPVLPQEVAVPG